MRTRRPIRWARRFAVGAVFVLSAATGTSSPAQGQRPATDTIPIRVPDSTQVQVIRLRDGSSIVGRVSEVNADTVRFAASFGTVSIPRASIVEVTMVERATVRASGEVWPPNPNATRLFFAPTGRMLAKGEGYFNDTYLFLLSIQGGLSSRFNLGGGMSVVPTEDFSDNILFVTPKIGVVASPRFNLAIGAFAGFVGGLVDEGEDASFGVLYGVATMGGLDGSVTLGTGVGYAGGQFADSPVAMLGGEKRLTRRVSLLTENYLIPNDDVHGVISYGLRFFGEKLSADLAFWNALGQDLYFPGIPYVAFSVRF